MLNVPFLAFDVSMKAYGPECEMVVSKRLLLPLLQGRSQIFDIDEANYTIAEGASH